MITTNTYERQFITIDGHRLAYIAAGNPNAPALLMAHGWISHAGVFRQTLDAFQNRYYCVAVDLLGHGHSDKPVDGDYGIPAQAERILKLADALGIRQFSFIGHSMGGQIGLYLAVTAPGRVTKLVSVAGVVTGRLSSYIRRIHQPIFQLGARLPSIWNFSRVAMRFRWYSNLFDRPLFYRVGHLEWDNPDRQMALIPGIEIPAYRDLQAIAALDLTASLGKIKAPTLAVFGKYDNTVPVENGFLVKWYVPDSHLVMIDACGHVPMSEQTDQYLTAVGTFLEQ